MVQPNPRRGLRVAFCAWAMIALVVYAVHLAFPNGSPGMADGSENPAYFSTSRGEMWWRTLLAASLVGGAAAVFFSLQELSDERTQRKYWQRTVAELAPRLHYVPELKTGERNEHDELPLCNQTEITKQDSASRQDWVTSTLRPTANERHIMRGMNFKSVEELDKALAKEPDQGALRQLDAWDEDDPEAEEKGDAESAAPIRVSVEGRGLADVRSEILVSIYGDARTDIGCILQQIPEEFDRKTLTSLLYKHEILRARLSSPLTITAEALRRELQPRIAELEIQAQDLRDQLARLQAEKRHLEDSLRCKISYAHEWEKWAECNVPIHERLRSDYIALRARCAELERQVQILLESYPPANSVLYQGKKHG